MSHDIDKHLQHARANQRQARDGIRSKAPHLALQGLTLAARALRDAGDVPLIQVNHDQAQAYRDRLKDQAHLLSEVRSLYTSN